MFKVEGLCGIVEGLCSAVFAASDLTTALSSRNLEYFRFHCDFSTKTKISGRKLGAMREIRWLEEGAREVLTSILSTSEQLKRQ